MDVAKLSSKGQVIIPKHLRTVHRWESGQELMVVDIRDGVLLKPKKAFSEDHYRRCGLLP
uniref:Looped-hinge helix DNA binding domain-containing protein, AbrB family n=1 Tax=Candidatus Kentrum sp. FW TaxID=2126338 RepID=A0A450U4K8_9GAMM|nr:MAG: looped-hinge helix DNA binding domain-containing protein, AbrB family [Candidatus Kentron sp. FW]